MRTYHPAKPQLHFWDSVAINIGIIIGVGIFRVPSEVASHIHSAPLVLFAWILGGALTLLGVLCYGELASQLPETGGTYIYLRESFGKTVGFLFGWTELAILRTASIAAVAFIFSDYLRELIPYGPSTGKVVALVAIVSFTGVNVVGLHVSVGVQRFLSFLKVLTMVIMAGLIYWFSPEPVSMVSAEASDAPGTGVRGFAVAMIPILWAYGGWQESTFLSGEFRDTRRSLPISLIVGVAIVCALYLMINWAYFQVIPVTQMPHRNAVAAEVFLQLFGPAGKWVITTAVLISACGALNSTVMTGGRIPYAVGKDVAGLARLGDESKQLGTPIVSLVTISVWSIVLLLWGNFEQLLFFSGFANWLFLTLVGVSVFRLRHKIPKVDHFKMFGFPIVPILFTIGSAVLCLVTILHSPRAALIGGVLILSGIPVYWLAKGKSDKKKSI